MNQDLIPFLRTHSYFSLLESLISPADIVNKAVEYQIPVLGMTDHRYLSGTVYFYEACKSAGIKPFIGLEVDFSFLGYCGLLTLFAANRRGWANLSALSSHLLIDDQPIQMSVLKSHHEGVICISGAPKGILRELILNSPPASGLPDQFLDEIQSIFHTNSYIEIQRFSNGPLKNETQMLKLAADHTIPIIATQGIHYLDPSDEQKYNTLTAIKHNASIHALPQQYLPPGKLHFPSPADFAYRFKDIPQAIENLHGLVARCNLELPLGETHFPSFPTPENLTQAEYLSAKAYSGAKKHYGKLTDTITERLEYELSIIVEMGYEPIFLIVEDIINHARKLGIPTSSRGSAASSLVAHCLDITSPDPIALNLYFERFLNPARRKPPDIDTDIASHRRDEVIQYVFDTYGKDRVAMVGTINRYRPKSAIGDVAKAYGLSPETIRQLSKKLPSSFSYHRNEEEDLFKPLEKQSTIPVIKDILRDARAFLDLPRHLSIHPGGIIIAPFPMTDLIPLVHSSSLDINHAQFDLDAIEKLGMVKIDLLGIRGLTVLGEVADKIYSWHISQYRDGLAVLDQIPEHDPDTSKTITEARTIGCFQIESPGMRGTLREIHANSKDDIIAALALYRPGPLRGGLRDAFVRRFRGEEPVAHIHPSLEPLLEDTLGVILYQEQVLRIAHELGGLTIAQADILRRAMSHFDPGGVMDTLRENFIAGAADRHQVPTDVAERIWEMMAAFAGYGFPKAHAASYAQLAWNSAWCKTHYPAEFMSAVLGFGGGYYSQRVYLMEARRLGLTINPPHINHSNTRFKVTYPKGEPVLYMGLDQVRDLTQNTIHAIIQRRPFQSLDDFLLRVDPLKKEAENLIMVSALEGLVTISEGLEHLKHERKPGQLALFSPKQQAEDWDQNQRLHAQREILGLSLTMSPLEQFADQITSSGALTTLEAQSNIGEKVRVAGMRQTLRRFRNRNNQTMCMLNLEDLDGTLQVLIHPTLYQQNRIALQEADVFIIEGVIEEDRERARVRMNALAVSPLFSTI